METLSPSPHDDSSGANPSSVKSEDNSPLNEGGRGSPPPNCAICLGTCRNKSFTDSCLHQFCFKCLLTWSKVKAECPLCKQNFKSIIHNVRSNHQYEEYMVEQRQTEETVERIDIDGLNITNTTRRFRYRTTLTLAREETLAIQQLLLHYPMVADVLPAARAPPRRRRSPTSFRRTVYRHNLWARLLPDFTGRFRDCTPEFYRYNDSQLHRLVPWLNRELHYLLNENIGHISYVISRILELLPQYHINSPEFREAMQRYFGDRTEHFLHELFCFASTPYDMPGYDRNVQYTTDSRISTMVNEVISSSDSDASVDSDIVMVSSSGPALQPAAGPSRMPQPAYPHNYIPPPATAPTTVNNVIPIETISQSDTDDDDSEVMVVGYIKPPHERTPEIVDLLGSDSDVIMQEPAPPEESAETSDGRTGPLVKLSLKRSRAAAADTDSDASYKPDPPRRRRRARSADSATTSDTCRSTPEPGTPPLPPVTPTKTTTSSTTTTTTTSATSSTTTTTTTTDDLSETVSTDSSADRRKKPHRRKTRRWSSKSNSRSHSNSSSDEEPRRNRKGRGRTTNNKRLKEDTEKEKRFDRKSASGKGVKSSKRIIGESSSRGTQVDMSRPGTSGSTGSAQSSSSNSRLRRRSSRETRRLRSVVNVMYNKNSTDSNSSGNTNLLNVLASSILNQNSNSGSDADRKRKEETRTENTPKSCLDLSVQRRRRESNADTDSEDNLPLNLSLPKYHVL